MRKTLWQKIYSFFGFWTFIEIDQIGNKRTTLYWCCLPWFKFFRKFDIVSWKE